MASPAQQRTHQAALRGAIRILRVEHPDLWKLTYRRARLLALIDPENDESTP